MTLIALINARILPLCCSLNHLSPGSGKISTFQPRILTKAGARLSMNPGIHALRIFRTTCISP